MFEFWKPEEGATIHFLELSPPVTYADGKLLDVKPICTDKSVKHPLQVLDKSGLPTGQVVYISDTTYQKLVSQIEEKAKQPQ